MQMLAPRVAQEKGWKLTDYRDVLRELKKQQLTGDAILPFYEKRIAEVEDIIRRERIVTLPQRKMRIRLASEAEAAAVPAPNMQPPRMIGNTGEMGTFVLPLQILSTISRSKPPPGRWSRTRGGRATSCSSRAWWSRASRSPARCSH
jgi:hypothetical protein